MIYVVSCVMDKYDPIEPWPIQTMDYERTVFTDQSPASIDEMGISVTLEAPHLHPRMAAKLPKCMPQRFITLGPDDVVIWVDGSIIPRTSEFVEHLVYNSNGQLSQYVHHDRPTGSIQQEAEASEWQGKYQGFPIHQQVVSYATEGMHDWGVWCTGVIVYRPVEGVGWHWLDVVGRDWLHEQTMWGYQDQISQPYVLWKYNLRPTPLPGFIINNPHFDLRPHGSER